MQRRDTIAQLSGTFELVAFGRRSHLLAQLRNETWDVLDRDLIVLGQDPDVVKTFAADPGVKPFVKKLLPPDQVQLKGGTSPARMRSVLRELGYLVELR